MVKKVITDVEKVKKVLERGVEEVIVRGHLEQALNSGKQLRVKFGIDPTAPDLHLGHTVSLRKLRQFQDLGHKAVLIIGDFTAMIGDPSGRTEARKPTTEKDIKSNLKKYLSLAGKVLDLKNTEIRYNSAWFKKNPDLLLDLARRESIQRLLERNDFEKRIKQGHEITLLETIYPLLQGYDSVEIKADVELGGTDQKFNLLMGRKLQRSFGMAEQDIVTMPILEGTDGVRKMSKSYGNYVALDAMPSDMFGKIMAIPDALIDKYRVLLTDLPAEALAKEGPREAKLELGKIIVGIYHGEKEGEKAKEEFVRVFSEHKKPEDIPEVRLGAQKMPLVDIILKTGAAKSKSEARRLIEQGGVRIDDMKQSDALAEIDLSSPRVLQVGPRKFYKIKK